MIWGRVKPMNWVEIFIATLTASIVGSVHCVGMCGPFVMMATHVPKSSLQSQDVLSANSTSPSIRRTAMIKLFAYHLGRLSTYLILGVIAGLAGTMVNRAGNTFGWGEIAAKMVGISMIIFGVARLMSMIGPPRLVQHTSSMERWTKGILSIGKRFRVSSPFPKAYILGLITTWLPCGWLYLFALAASSTGSVARASWMMFAFWIGTLPLLSLLALGGQTVSNHGFRDRLASTPVLGLLSKIPIQAIVACIMISFGVYTTVYRSQVSLEGMISPMRTGELTRESIAALKDEPLPCCLDSGKTFTTAGSKSVSP